MNNYKYLLSIMTEEQLEKVNRLNSKVYISAVDLYHFYDRLYLEALEGDDKVLIKRYADWRSEAYSQAMIDQSEWRESMNEIRRRANEKLDCHFTMIKPWSIREREEDE